MVRTLVSLVALAASSANPVTAQPIDAMSDQITIAQCSVATVDGGTIVSTEVNTPPKVKRAWIQKLSQTARGGPGGGPRVLAMWEPIELSLDVTAADGVTPTVTAHAINTKGMGANDRSVALDVTAADGVTPTVTAHAINTKGAGSGDRSVAPAGASCSGGKVSMQDLHFVNSAKSSASQWSCSVTTTATGPQFTVGLLLPTVQKRGDPAPSSSARTASPQGSYLATIDVHGGTAPGNVVANCSSTAKGVVGYDLKSHIKL